MAGKRGMMVHWLFAEAGDIDYYANGFDINKFMADFDATKSDYLVFTIGQNKGTYASPNSKLVEYGIPSGCCAKRDLVGEIAAAVHARGKKFIAYLPSEVKANTTVNEILSWSNRTEFQTKYCAVIREWSKRWGTNVDGWWMDGFYNQGEYWDEDSGFDQSVWAAALRAGNANAVVAFNPSLGAQTPRTDLLSDGLLTDYLAGEINSPSAINDWTLKEFVDDDSTCRLHLLMPIDGFWGAYWPWSSAGSNNPYSGTPDQSYLNRLSYIGQFPDPVVSESDLSTFIQNVFNVNGAVTINVGVNASGTLNPASVALLAKMPGGSDSTSAPAGTTVESLIGEWSSTPMAMDGSTFATTGNLVYAYCTAKENKTVNGVEFTGLSDDPATASSSFEFSPAFASTQNASDDGATDDDLKTIACLAWKATSSSQRADVTFKGLTSGHRYCIQLYIHDTYSYNSAVIGPDAKSTVIYREETQTPYSGQDWSRGGVFTGYITATATTHSVTLMYPTTDRMELNALQVRDLDAGESGGGGDDPSEDDPEEDDPTEDDPTGDDPAVPVVGSWSAIAMDSAGQSFSTEGDLVFAFCRDRGDSGMTYSNSACSVVFHYLHTLWDEVTKYHGDQGGVATDGPYDNGLQGCDYVVTEPQLNEDGDGDCGNEGLGNSMSGFGSILGAAWTGPSLSGTSGKATYTLKQLQSGNSYLVEFFVHYHDASAKSITAPDGSTAVTLGGDGWTYGGLLRGTFTATNATQDIVLTYSDVGDFRMNAIQLRNLGAVSNYDNWASTNNLSGTDAAWDATPAIWGGEWANAFIYTYGDGLTNNTPLMTISFDADGKPVITTPDELRSDFNPQVIGSTDVTNWTTTVELNKSGNDWTLPNDTSANFFRVQLEK